MTNDNPLGNEGETPLEQSHEITPEQLQHEHEKNAFATHINTSEEKVPDNFENAGAWFDSLKEAQKGYTQARQEIAELKTQQETVVPDVKPVEQLTDQLRIPQPGQAEEQSVAITGLDEGTYEAWGMEFAANGDFSENTRNDIKQRTGFTDRMLGDYIEAQKSRLRESYSKAANTVGGQDRLNKIFKWASNNLPADDMQGINMGLASPQYEVTLRGLASMYDSSVTATKAKEPVKNENLTQVAASQKGILPYQNQREFKAERNDPKFQFEPQYRDMVQRKMAITDWNTLPV
jgi:hypothetical protein